ncbi:MAG: LON peptidase substrate-binding domain-containing protein [Planctomycetes bacterium]|nr:LON peptidase substrate-binding domain-containing protein [Planctomycetota bacterium]
MSVLPAELPLFPLPDHVLIPGLPQPYRVFEPRYLALVRGLLQASSAERWLAMPCLEPGWEADYQGSPPVRPIAAAALVRRIEEGPGGEYHILVEGIARIRLVEITSFQPYRLARAEALADRPEVASAAAMQGLLDQLAGLGDRIDLDALGLSLLLAADSAHRLLVDRLGALLIRVTDERQRYLETVDLTARIAQVRRELDGLSGDGGAMDRRWKPSTN